MKFDKLEELATNALGAMVDVINQKTEELRHLDVRYMVKEKSGKLPEFFELSGESQDAARHVLAEMLLVSYRHELKLTRDEITELGHKVRKAFMTLENDQTKAECCDSRMAHAEIGQFVK
ncbi:TPA: hypothetical protein RG717_002307 [Morganella morganii subsp. morganii]|nr:hypothetical protein [Morganella morganii subsp. morganii]